ncbi:hypothetical protein lerEdw1_011519 [Lerista edwardsae]|nr:hypothetical protein lerEdw1_011519 [Lerista edwardsae]
MDAAGRAGILLLLLAALSSAREVHLPPGPLFRVEGTAVSLPCSVSEYEGPTRQHFEWFLYRPASPGIAIGVVSTRDPKFPYAVFGPRVQAGDVSVWRLRGDAVELRIGEVRLEDRGVYECYTPTTDSKYHGNYSAKVELRVIPDKLLLSAASPSLAKATFRSPAPPAPSPPQVPLSEGQELQLLCTAASETRQHTHLSVSFGLSAPEGPAAEPGGALREVIGVRRDFAVEAGGSFAERHRARELSVAKLGDRQYQMVLGGLRPEDAGTYHCTAGEWIQDPDGTWQQIAEKRVALAQVAVRPIAAQLAISAGPARVRLRSGEALELTCNASGVQTPALPQVAYAVAWEVSQGGAQEEGRLVAQLDADGGLALGESYSSRELRIESAQPGDVGAYRCLVRAFVRSPRGELRQVASGRSEALTVDIKSEDVSGDWDVSFFLLPPPPPPPPPPVLLEASAWLPSATIFRGDTAEVRCNVSVESTQAVHLALSWWVQLPQEDPEPYTALLASVSREGVADLGRRPSGGAVSVDKVGPLSHRLRIHGVQPSDEGKYHCAVTAWVRFPDGGWYNAGAVESNVVTVYPYALPLDTLFLPLVVGVSSALFTGITVLVAVTCCFMRRLRKR